MGAATMILFLGLALMDLKGASIVVAPDAIPSERFAAEEFQCFFEQASGVRLPITDTRKGPGPQVLIGPGVTGFDTTGFGPEDLRIVVRDNTIAIAGGRPRAKRICNGPPALRRRSPLQHCSLRPWGDTSRRWQETLTLLRPDRSRRGGSRSN